MRRKRAKPRKDRTRFLELCTGRDIEAIIPQSNAYLLHLESLVDGKWTHEMDRLIHAEYVLHSESFEKIV